MQSILAGPTLLLASGLRLSTTRFAGRLWRSLALLAATLVLLRLSGLA